MAPQKRLDEFLLRRSEEMPPDVKALSPITTLSEAAIYKRQRSHTPRIEMAELYKFLLWTHCHTKKINCRAALNWWIIWQQTNIYLSFQSKLCNCSPLSFMPCFSKIISKLLSLVTYKSAAMCSIISPEAISGRKKMKSKQRKSTLFQFIFLLTIPGIHDSSRYMWFYSPSGIYNQRDTR